MSDTDFSFLKQMTELHALSKLIEFVCYYRQRDGDGGTNGTCLFCNFKKIAFQFL